MHYNWNVFKTRYKEMYVFQLLHWSKRSCFCPEPETLPEVCLSSSSGRRFQIFDETETLSRSRAPAEGLFLSSSPKPQRHFPQAELFPSLLSVDQEASPVGTAIMWSFFLILQNTQSRGAGCLRAAGEEAVSKGLVQTEYLWFCRRF